jgi:hypothetical protein
MSPAVETLHAIRVRIDDLGRCLSGALERLGLGPDDADVLAGVLLDRVARPCRRRSSGLDRAHTCAQRTADRPRSPGDPGAGPSVRPIHGSDETIVSGG